MEYLEEAYFFQIFSVTCNLSFLTTFVVSSRCGIVENSSWFYGNNGSMVLHSQFISTMLMVVLNDKDKHFSNFNLTKGNEDPEDFTFWNQLRKLSNDNLRFDMEVNLPAELFGSLKTDGFHSLKNKLRQKLRPIKNHKLSREPKLHSNQNDVRKKP